MSQPRVILITFDLRQVFFITEFFTEFTFPFQNCCVVNLSRVGDDVDHAVVFDNFKTHLEKDGNYYFKNSDSKEPWIIIPNNRATTDQTRTYTECADRGVDGAEFKNAMNDQHKNIMPSEVIKIFKDTIAPLEVDFDFLNQSNNDQKWTIADTAYALIIEKI